MDFHQSVENIAKKIKNINLFFEMGRNDLSIIVENKFEIILTHYPLWDNEQFLYMLGSVESKTIIKKHIPEKIIVDFLLEIKNNSYSLDSKNKTLLN